MTDPVCAMVLAPHPDDAELSCGGTVMRLVEAGHRVAIVDMTRGEMGTVGTPETRAEECEAATRVLGVHERRNLGLPDAFVRDDDDALRAVIGAIRDLRPEILFAPLDRDLHPDHEATGLVARRAFFHSGLAKVMPELGAPHRPQTLLHYPLHHEVDPSLCVDISSVAARKLDAIRCYATQFGGDNQHRARLDVLQRAEARDRFYGSRIGTMAAEAFWSDGPLVIRDPSTLL